MAIKKNILLFLISFFTLVAVDAQEMKDILRSQGEKENIYDKELSGILRLHTNGFGVGVNIGKTQTYYLSKFWQFELVHLKDSREYTSRVDFSPFPQGRGGNSFIYGKQNSFFGLHAGYGQKHSLSGKAKKQGVVVGLSYSGGASLGIIKPYYLEIYKFNSSGMPIGTVPMRYSEETASSFLSRNAIAGGAGFGYGFNEISLTPGVQGKAALHLDWGAYTEYVRAAEVGFMADFYFKEVPIMVSENSKAVFFNLYAAIIFGKRK